MPQKRIDKKKFNVDIYKKETDFIAAPEAAERCGVSYTHFIAELNANRFPGRRAGRVWEVPVKAVEDAIRLTVFHPRVKDGVKTEVVRYSFSKTDDVVEVKLKFDKDKFKLVESILLNNGTTFGEFVGEKFESIYKEMAKKLKNITIKS